MGNEEQFDTIPDSTSGVNNNQQTNNVVSNNISINNNTQQSTYKPKVEEKKPFYFIPEDKPIVIKPIEKASPFKNLFRSSSVSKSKRILLDNLALLLSSGMGITSSLRTILNNSQNKSINKDLEKIIKSVESGKTLWESFEQEAFLPKFLISLIKIGEDSGNLSEKIKKTVLSLEKDARRASQLKTALFYPVFVMSLTFIIGAGVSIFVLPKIGDVLVSLDVELPIVTKIMVEIGVFLEKYWLTVIPPIIILLGISFYMIFVFSKTKWIGQWITFHLPVFNTLINRTEVSRFAYNLSMLMSSGVPITVALNSISEVHEYYMYKNFLKILVEEVNQGKTFTNSFRKYRKMTNYLFPYTAQDIISAGEESGKLVDVLDTIGSKFEEEAEQISKTIGVLIEPVLLIIVWAGVVFLAVAILLPIYTLVGNFNA